MDGMTSEVAQLDASVRGMSQKIANADENLRDQLKAFLEVCLDVY